MKVSKREDRLVRRLECVENEACRSGLSAIEQLSAADGQCRSGSWTKRQDAAAPVQLNMQDKRRTSKAHWKLI